MMNCIAMHDDTQYWMILIIPVCVWMNGLWFNFVYNNDWLWNNAWLWWIIVFEESNKAIIVKSNWLHAHVIDSTEQYMNIKDGFEWIFTIFTSISDHWNQSTFYMFMWQGNSYPMKIVMMTIRYIMMISPWSDLLEVFHRF